MTELPSRPVSDTAALRNYPRVYQRYERLLETSSDLASTLELDSLLGRIVEVAAELTEAEAASLLLYDVETHHLYFEAATAGIDEAMGKTPIPVTNSIAGWVFTEGKSILVDDVLRDARFFREVDVLTRFQTRNVLAAPLRTKDKTIGVIEVVNKRQGMFDEDDVRLLQTLAAQAAVAIENSRLFQQSDLIAEMVHELRTPLASLTAASYLLQRPDLPEDQRSKLGATVQSEVRRLNEMATDFLELSRLESGRVRMTREPVHLGGLITECLEIIRPLAEAEQIRLEEHTDRDIPPVHGDRNRLKQLVLNLLTNAMKFNHRGGVVAVGLLRQGDLAELSVRDSGRGIPPDSIAHIFERFYRVPEQESTTAGTGLGLTIAKRIVENHGGRVTLESEVGVGSTFTVLLPVGPRDPPAPPTVTPAPA
ncbi:MAG: GAF domain-containing sensor histidine kinase [Anaerolineales bacterium]|nr:GAF domain-containing sensor histidine kinase [Anaerolineales bacterium]